MTSEKLRGSICGAPSENHDAENSGLTKYEFSGWMRRCVPRRKIRRAGTRPITKIRADTKIPAARNARGRDFFLLLEVSEAAVVGAILLHNFPIRFQLEGQLAYPGLGECFGVIHGDIDR